MAEGNKNYDDGNSRKGPECAVCKHLRRACKPTCTLGSFFPESEPTEFAAVRKIFGIPNLTKIIQGQDSNEKKTRAAQAMKYQAMMWERYPDSGPSGYISALREENDDLRGLMLQLLPLFRGNPLPNNPLNVHVNPHMFASTSSAAANVGNSQHNWVLSHGNNVPVFQNNGQMGFDGNGVLQRNVIMENQEIRGSHGIERYNGTNANFVVGGHNGNSSNVGVGGLDGYSNVPGYKWRTAETKARRIGNRNSISHVEHVGDTSRTQRLIPHQQGYGRNDGSNANFGVGGYNGNNSNVGVGGLDGYSNVQGYEWGTAGMEARRTGNMNRISGVEHVGGTSRTQLLIPRQRGYGGNEGSDNVRGYDSGIVGMQAEGRNANDNGVYRQRGEVEVAQTGTSSRSEQPTKKET